MSDNFYRELRFALPISLIIWALFVWLALSIFSPASAGGVEPSDIATAALEDAMTRADADRFEYAGAVILQTDGAYRTTALQRCEETEFKIVVKLARGEKLVAIYHTHPFGLRHESLSSRPSFEDEQIARKLRIPSYIGIVSSKQIIKVTT